MKALSLLFISSILLSCNKKSDPAPDKYKPLVIILTVLVDNSKPLGQDVQVIYKRDSRIDTLTYSNYPGIVHYIKIGDYENISLKCENYMDAYVKDDDGQLTKTGVYLDYASQNEIHFKTSAIK